MEEINTPPLDRRCPACGAAMPAGARFCGACGGESAAPEPGEAVAGAVAPASLSAGVALAPDLPAAPAADAPAVAGAAPAAARVEQAGGDAGRLCPWCGAVSPPEAVRCVACDAMFPTPEGDAALERAAQARIQAIESELKQRRAGWWPFRAR